MRLHRLPGPDVDVLAWQAGQWLPFHSGAGPRALLAALPDQELAAYVARTEERSTRHGPLSADDVRKLVDDTRRRGWSLNLEDLADGVSSLDVAIVSGTSTPSYALSVAGLTASYQGRQLNDTATAGVAAAGQLARLIAGRF